MKNIRWLSEVVITLLVICILSAFTFAATGCGRSITNGELIGQVKKVQPHTPIICPEYVTADVSMGVMNNGVGSMSTHDIQVVVPNEFEKAFTEASESGKIVKIHYDTWRFAPCSEYEWATSVAYLSPPN